MRGEEWTRWKIGWSPEENKEMSLRMKTVLKKKLLTETIAAISPSTESCTTNDGQPREDLERFWMIKERMHNESERGMLEIAATQLYAEIDTDGNEMHTQTTLTEKTEECPVVGKCEVVNKSITDICIYSKETDIAKIEEEQIGLGQTPVPNSTPS